MIVKLIYKINVMVYPNCTDEHHTQTNQSPLPNPHLQSGIEEIDFLLQVGATARQGLLDVPLIRSTEILLLEDNLHQIQRHVPKK